MARGTLVMSKQEYLQAQADTAKLSLADFAEMGIDAIECDCNWQHCDGWMLHFVVPEQCRK